MTKKMTRNEKMDRGRRWLELVRGAGDAGSKAEYLREKGYAEDEVEELMREEGANEPLEGA